MVIELSLKRKQSWKLTYIRNSIAETDAPDAIKVLIKQRRRWINGSNAATIHAIRKCKGLCRSTHSCSFKIVAYMYILY